MLVQNGITTFEGASSLPNIDLADVFPPPTLSDKDVKQYESQIAELRSQNDQL